MLRCHRIETSAVPFVDTWGDEQETDCPLES
jgi:hypothetical protein